MPKINLTPEDKAKLIEAINRGTEPTADLLPKLFPGIAEKFDVQALDRAKIPTLEYAGKRSKAAILAEAGAGIGAAPLQRVRFFGDAKRVEWRNLIVQGDNLQFLKTCYNNTDPLIKDKVKSKVKLIYFDPPFGTGDEYGGNDGEISYSAKIKGSEFIESLRERIIYLRELLSKDGSMFMRIDYHFGHYAKVIMDEIFGEGNFKNEIVINRFKRQLRGLKQFNIATDVLLFYGKDAKANIFKEVMRTRLCSFCGSEKEAAWIPMSSPGLRRPPERVILGKKMLPPRGRHWTFKQSTLDAMEEAGRIRMSEGDVYTDLEGNRVCGVPEYLQTDDTPVDSNWTDLKGYVRSKRYPTENPEELLARVVFVASEENDLVMDVFGGSGTTAAVSEKMGRRWITGDFGKHSIYTMQKRMLNIANSPKIIEGSPKSGRHSKPAKPFDVISSGAYDFSHIMDLRKHKETYVDFVLGLFHLARNEEKARKYKLANIYTVKDNNPVEVFPVWDDEFLKEVKIDEAYLQGIINQSGEKLKGEYYIITPESCTNISDTLLKNQDGKDVQFIIKTFPYKVLEDISRNLELQEQPSSQDNVNNLITSTAFYFNEDVKFAAKRTKQGLKIIKFESKILDKNGDRFEGFSGLAMILVDLDYEPAKPFDMDKTVFAKEVEEDGSVKIDGLTKSVGLIAIDKHGNESKPFNLE